MYPTAQSDNLIYVVSILSKIIEWGLMGIVIKFLRYSNVGGLVYNVWLYVILDWFIYLAMFKLLFYSFHISVSWWFFTGVWVRASLLMSPGLISGFWPFLAMPVVWIVSTRLPTSKSSRPFNNPLVIVPNAVFKLFSRNLLSYLHLFISSERLYICIQNVYIYMYMYTERLCICICI